MGGSFIPGFDGTIGACLVGLLIATFLEGVLTTQCYVYYNQSKDDRRSLRLLVGFVWVMDFFHWICLCTMLYNYTVTNWGNPGPLADATIGFDISILLTTFIACTVQFYFGWRTWQLTRSYLLTGTIFLLSSISLGTGTACGVLTFILVKFTAFLPYRWLVSLWLAAAAAADIFIAGTLSWTLWNSRTGFKATDSLLTKLIVWTMNTGLLTSLVALLDIIFFDTSDTLIYFAFNMMLGKLYANMFLATLNRRLSSRIQLESSRSGTHAESIGNWSRPKGSENGMNVYVTSETATYLGSENHMATQHAVPMMDLKPMYKHDGTPRSLDNDHKAIAFDMA